MAMQLLGVELCRIAHAWTCAVLEHVPPLQVVLGSSCVVYSAYWRTQVVTLLKITRRVCSRQIGPHNAAGIVARQAGCSVVCMTV